MHVKSFCSAILLFTVINSCSSVRSENVDDRSSSRREIALQSKSNKESTVNESASSPQNGLDKKSINSLSISYDGRLFATADSMGRIRLWEIHTLRLMREIYDSHNAEALSSVAFSDDGSYLSYSDEHGNVVVLNANNYKVLARLVNETESAVMDIDYAGNLVSIVRSDGSFQIWDISNKRLVNQKKFRAVLNAVKWFGRKKKWIVSGLNTGIWLFPIGTNSDGWIGEERNEWPSPKGQSTSIWDVDVYESKEEIFAASSIGILKVAKNSKRSARIEGPMAYALALVKDSDDDSLNVLVGLRNGNLEIRNPKSLKKELEYRDLLCENVNDLMSDECSINAIDSNIKSATWIAANNRGSVLIYDNGKIRCENLSDIQVEENVGGTGAK